MTMSKMRSAALTLAAAAALGAPVATAQPAAAQPAAAQPAAAQPAAAQPAATRFAAGCTGVPQVASAQVEDRTGATVAVLDVYESGERVCATAVSTTSRRVALTVAVTVQDKGRSRSKMTYRAHTRIGFARVARALSDSRLRAVRMRAVTSNSRGSAVYVVPVDLTTDATAPASSPAPSSTPAGAV